MNYTTPTTKAEMYEALNEIYYFYRIKLVEYEDIELEPLELTRMSFTPLTDAQLLAKAQTLLSAAQNLRLMEYVDGLTDKLAEIEEKKTAEQKAFEERVNNVKETYLAAKEAIDKQAVKNGVVSSGVYAEKLAELEREKGEKIALITAEHTAFSDGLDEKAERYETLIEDAEDKFEDICEAEVQAKYLELKDEQDKTVRQVFEYNNELDEKEQRYVNSIDKINASLRMRHIEIRLNGITKDELVERGYYNDVIGCINAYYSRLTPAAAYADIRSESRLTVYLDDYYTNVLYYYKLNAEA